MKLSLPGFFQRRKAAPEQQSRPLPELGENMKPVSLTHTRNQLLLAGVVSAVALAYLVFQLMAVQVARVLEQQTATVTDLVAAQVSATAQYYRDAATALASDPDIAIMLKQGNSERLEERAASVRRLFPAALNVRLLPPGLSEIDLQASPPLSYAPLVQLRAAELGEAPVPAEVHQFNTPQQHVNIVQRVPDPAGAGVAGLVMLSLNTGLLQDILDDLQHTGYIELQQGGDKGAPAVVARRGDTNLKSGEPERVVPVPGSRWQVAYWPVTGSLAYLGRVGMQVLAIAAIAAVLVLAVTVLLFRRLTGAIRFNEVSMVTLMKDFRDGHMRQGYQAGLLEMQDTINFMLQLATGARDKVRRKPVAREQDGDVPHEQLAGAVSEINEQVRDRDRHERREGVAADFGGKDGDGSMIVEDSVPGSGGHGSPMDASIFRAYDIRGVVGQTLTVDVVRLIGRAIGSETLQRGRNTIVVGRDGRLSGPELSTALIEGIVSTGCNVRDIGCVPTPVLYFATHHLGTQSGVVVTGSHNPPDYNGLKIVIDGETLSGESIQSLRERIEQHDFISGQGSVDRLNMVATYIERIHDDVTLARPLKVVMDCGNGVAGAVGPDLLRALGCEVIELFCEVDGNFPNHHPDPSKVANLRDLVSAVAASHADIGLAFDGDGDRMGVVTSTGDVIWPDRVLMLFAMDILERNPGGQIIYDVKCTRLLDGIIRRAGGQPLMWKTGHSIIKAKMRKTGALLAGEMSGHIFIKERWYGFDDGLYAAARLLEILSRDPRATADVFDALPNSVNTPELNVPMQEGQPPVFINRLLESAHFEGAQVHTIDGLRAEFEDGWGLVRASNTTPVLVLRFEADDDAALKRIMGEFRRVMLQVEPGLQLPF